MIDTCEKERTVEIERIEKGIPDEETNVPKKSDFELLQESTDSEYLRKTVLPLLIPALKLVDVERPIDPISFISVYCLKNKDRVKIPVPPPEYFEKKEEAQKEEEE